MKPCPLGAIVRTKELMVLREAVRYALEMKECERDCNRVPNPRNRNALDRAQEAAWAREIRQFNTVLRNLDAVIMVR